MKKTSGQKLWVNEFSKSPDSQGPCESEKLQLCFDHNFGKDQYFDP